MILTETRSGGILFVSNLLITLELVYCDCISLKSSGSAAIVIFRSVGETSEVLGVSC